MPETPDSSASVKSTSTPSDGAPSESSPPGGACPDGDPPDGSVTIWLHAMHAGDRDAFARLWERYHSRLLSLARRRLQALNSRAVDEEDVALSAFARFCRAAEEGRIAALSNRGDLWRLLLKITLERSIDARRRETAQIRGGGQVFSAHSENLDGRMLDPVDEQPSPEMAAILADEFTHLMAALRRDDLQEIAVLRLDGLTNKELASHFGLSERSIERRLHLIRKTWIRCGRHAS